MMELLLMFVVVPLIVLLATGTGMKRAEDDFHARGGEADVPGGVRLGCLLLPALIVLALLVIGAAGMGWQYR